MQATLIASNEQDRYARCIENSKRVRWEIERDVIRDRRFDLRHKFLPDGLTLSDRLDFLSPGERRLISQIQGRTYANMFGLVERFVGAKMLELSHEHALGNQVALEALVRFTDEELKHQALFRRIESLTAAQMPPGYAFLPQPDEVARFVLGKCSWSVLALTCHIELVTQVHYRESIADDPLISPLFKDVFLFHWKEESQHAVLDELEWRRADEQLGEAERDRGVDDLIALVAGVDGLLQMQAASDARYFKVNKPQAGTLSDEEWARLEAVLLAAYRWQYIVSGAQHPHFNKLLGELLTPTQQRRIGTALSPLMR